MTFAAQNIAIESRFNTNWGSTTAIKWDNAHFTQPQNTAWVEFQIVDQGAACISVHGSDVLYRHTGTISINIYTPLNTGTAAGRAYADQAAAIFRGQQFSGVTCREAAITRFGETDGWFVYNVSISFFRDEAF